ncbi:MAG: acyl-CoA dehydrogenase [Deltaproteobacteria bacterium]|nr:MAG: acyl-CoA dehydrogenase [Deltaproteobacteria bacterium]
MSETFVKGGSFLVDESYPDAITTPEDFTSEQLMYAKTARDFMVNEVIPNSEKIEEKDLSFNHELMKKAGELGLLMGDVPEAYGGMGLDKTSCAIIAEHISGQGSFQTMVMAHTGIGTLPIVYYGTEAHKEKYLPGLATGELVGCYCLTEPSAGSDALGARTKAVLSDDGKSYILNGTKQFITNGGFADIFTIFAKIDGEKFTAFLLEKDTPGLSIGPEEHKMGIKGSSTTTVILEDAMVPVENVLGEIGEGHKIAFNILNIGRFKLGVGALGNAKIALSEALLYALERKQFNTPIAKFGAVGEKLASMYCGIYAAEAVSYRTAGLIDRLLDTSADRYGEAALQSIEEYSVECAMVKVFCSETADYVFDEAIQIHGGYGFCSEYPAERYYRDNRIARLYEGTNEINRIVIGTMLLRKAAAGQLPLFAGAEELAPAKTAEGLLGEEKALVANLKKITTAVMGLAAGKLGKALSKEQSILLRIADMVTATFAAESAMLRALKDAAKRGESGAPLPLAAAKVTCENSMVEVEALARQCLVALGEEGAIDTISQLTNRKSADTISLTKAIAAKLIEAERVIL